MSVTEHRRNQLHNRAHEVLGVEEGDALMELLPPVGWGDVATRRDVSDVRKDMDHHVAAVRQDLTIVRKDMDNHVTALRQDLTALRKDMDNHVTALRQDLTALRKGMDSRVAGLRQDMDHLGTGLRHEIAMAETRLRAEMAQHQEQTHKDFAGVYKAMSRVMWTMTVSMIGTVVASAGFAFTAGVAL